MSGFKRNQQTFLSTKTPSYVPYRIYAYYFQGYIRFTVAVDILFDDYQCSVIVIIQMAMNLKQESLQLIGIGQNNQFYLTEQAKKLLLSINKPVAVVTIAGVYRSGKSYLVNRLIRNKHNGFATGSSIEPVTKGLSIWGRPIPAKDQDGNQFVYLAVDSEGVGSCQQEMKYDLKILMLAFLMSSTVIYNSVGAIDEVTLDQLRTVLNLRQALPQAHQERAKLVWVLRDFSLQLVNKNGDEVGPNDYLEQCLEQVPSNSFQIRKKNEIRRAIKETFSKRCCFPLVRPTIREDDLRNLEPNSLRPQFLQGIESIREEVFTGSKYDIKRIRNTALTGKLLASLLEECCEVLNQNRMPQIKSMWESIRECSYESTFESLTADMKMEVGRVALPLPKEELRMKLNEIQNRMYLRLEKEYQQLQPFKRYHRQFIHIVQKLNKQVKRNNAQITKQKTLKDLRDFVKSSINLQNVQPTNMSLVKVLVDRIELRAKGQPQGYEYVLSVLFDVMHISEQKAILAQRQALERQQFYEAGCQQRRNTDLSLASLRHDYHEALKTINNLKLIQETAQKQGALCRQQLEMLRATCNNMQQEANIKVQSILRQVQEANFRARQRAEENSALTKKLREEKCELQLQVEALKEEKLREGLNQRKQIIFEEKMKETWDRFEQERLFFRKEMDKLRKQSQAHLQKYQQERRYRERESQQFAKEKQAFLAKQRESVHQLQQLKSLHIQTKKTYNATFDALKDNDRIFKSIENVSHAKMTTGKKNTEGLELARRQFESELERSRAQFEEEVKHLKFQLAKANNLNNQQRLKFSEQESKYRSCITEKQRLERELQTANLRFSDTMGEVQLAKERERSLYEQSIVRLLNNLQKREYSTVQNYRR